VDGAFELVEVEDLGEVKEGARGRGDRDAALFRHLVVGECDAMGEDARALAASPQGNLRPRRCIADAPQRGGRAMAQGGSRAGGEDRRHPTALPGQGAVADRIDAAMHEVQPAGREAAIDRAVREPERHELGPRHDPVLCGRQRRDRGVRGSSGGFTPICVANPPLDCHTPMVARIASWITTQTHQHCAGTPLTSCAPSPRCPRSAPREPRAAEQRDRSQRRG